MDRRQRSSPLQSRRAIDFGDEKDGREMHAGRCAARLRGCEIAVGPWRDGRDKGRKRRGRGEDEDRQG